MEKYWNEISVFLRERLLNKYSIKLKKEDHVYTYFAALPPYTRISLFHAWQYHIKHTVAGRKSIRQKSKERRIKKRKNNNNK